MPIIAITPALAQKYRFSIRKYEYEFADEDMRREAEPHLQKFITRIVVKLSGGKRGIDLQIMHHSDEVLALGERHDVT